MPTMPLRALMLINAYSKPVTRPDWRKCGKGDDLFDEIIESPVFDVYYNKEYERSYTFKGVQIFKGRGRFSGYITSK